jgi:hypothetical protein
MDETKSEWCPTADFGINISEISYERVNTLIGCHSAEGETFSKTKERNVYTITRTIP